MAAVEAAQVAAAVLEQEAALVGALAGPEQEEESLQAAPRYSLLQAALALAAAQLVDHMMVVPPELETSMLSAASRFKEADSMEVS